MYMYKSCQIMNTSSDDEHYEYQKYLYRRKEWPGYKKTGKFNDVAIFIQEIYRLIPFIHGSFYKFHPLNMPYIMVGQIEVVGIIIKIIKKQMCYDLTVNDGSGAITVIQKINNLESEQDERKRIDEKHKRLAKAALLGKKWQQHDSTTEPLPIRFPKVRPDIEYDSKIPIRYRAYLEHKWYEEVNHGLLGKPIELYDYLHVKGFIQLNFDQYPAPEKEISFEDICVANPYIVATRDKFKLISEYDYNKIMLKIMNNVKKRYETAE